jgi:hypothetical protein
MIIIKDRRASDTKSTDAAAREEGESIDFERLSLEEAQNEANCRKSVLRCLTLITVAGLVLAAIAFFSLAGVWLVHLVAPEHSSWLWLSAHQFTLIQTGLLSSVVSVSASGGLRKVLSAKA